jgi:glycerol uptake facilitator-like aquaporin
MRLRRVYAEYMGTLMLVMGVCLCNGTEIGVPTVLWSAIIGTGFVSGAQYNPAMTTAIVLIGLARKRMSRHDFWEHMLYYPIHFLGSFSGSLISWAIKNETYHLFIPEGVSLVRAYFAEVMATTLLILVATVGGQLQDSIFIYTFAVTMVIFANIHNYTNISGACMNPAVGIGVNVVDAMKHGHERVQHLYIYIFGPLTASIVATLLYLAIDPESIREKWRHERIEAMAVLKKESSRRVVPLNFST